MHERGVDPALQQVLQHRLYSPRARMVQRARRYADRLEAIVKARMAQ